MRPLVSALVVLAAVVTAAAPARAADVEPMLVRGDGPGPILADGSAVWATQADRRVTVRSRPVLGGPERVIAQARVASHPEPVALAGGAGTGVLLAYEINDREKRTLYGTPSVPLAPVQVMAVPGGQDIFGDLLPTGAGILRPGSMESGGSTVVLTQPPDRYRVLTFPRAIGGFSTYKAAGRFLATTTLTKQITKQMAVIDLPSGEVQRIIAAPEKDLITDFAVGSDGSVAAITVLGRTIFAGPASATFSELRRGDAVDIALDGTRIAQATVINGQRTAARVEVFDVKEPRRTLSRGPVIANPPDLAIEGDAVAYRVVGCGIVADAVGGDTGPLLPAGPCVRTRVSFNTPTAASRGQKRSVVAIPVECLAGPRGQCRIRVAVNLEGVRRVGTVTTTLATGQSRTLRLRTRGRLARQVVAERAGLRASVRVTDPDGKTWVQDEEIGLTAVE